MHRVPLESRQLYTKMMRGECVTVEVLVHGVLARVSVVSRCHWKLTVL